MKSRINDKYFSIDTFGYYPIIALLNFSFDVLHCPVGQGFNQIDIPPQTNPIAPFFLGNFQVHTGRFKGIDTIHAQGQ